MTRTRLRERLEVRLDVILGVADACVLITGPNPTIITIATVSATPSRTAHEVPTASGSNDGASAGITRRLDREGADSHSPDSTQTGPAQAMPSSACSTRR
ncbi:MAG: hypothetical protein V5A44_12980 [Haloarculaceae archaeon]